VSDIPKTPDLNMQLANAVAEVARAQDALQLAVSRTAGARNAEADALNRANEAQRHFDTLVAEVRKSAPQSTDWRVNLFN
jgi:hypothetical protein